MAWSVAIANLRIILGALIGIADHQGNRRAGGNQDFGVFVIRHDPRKHLYSVRFLALRGELRLTGFALVEKGLHFCDGKANAGRAAIYYAAKCCPVAFTPGCYAEKVTEGIERHVSSVSRGRVVSLQGPGAVRPFILASASSVSRFRQTPKCRDEWALIGLPGDGVNAACMLRL